MGDNIVFKIIKSHLVDGDLNSENQITISVDQTLGHDLTAIMAGQTLTAVNADKVSTEASVFYCDHNTLCATSENSDDHMYLKSCAKRFGAYYSKPGNGICHFLHCQRFAKPGKVMLGADSHTPTSGALGMLAIGSGGLTVAKSMVGEGFKMIKPKVLQVKFLGKLNPGVSAKDISLEILRKLTVKGGIGYIIEYTGDGISSLSITERQTTANMSIELGATTGIFPSDEVTKKFLEAQNRGSDYIELKPDKDAIYEKTIEINLDELEPLIAKPHMPDLVCKVKNLEKIEPNSVFIGSCTNASYSDIAKAAKILKGRKVNKEIDCTIAPGSKQVLEQLIKDGVLADLVESGCRILECACGPCIGIGQVPCNNGVAVRTSNRNFSGRSGNNNASVYLVSPETAAATAIKGYISDPRYVYEVEKLLDVKEPEKYIIDDSSFITPEDVLDNRSEKIIKGPNISDLPQKAPLENKIEAGVVIKLGDNITTDDIIPGGASILKYISNIPKFAEYTFCYSDSTFVKRAKEMKTSVIVGGDNYGQGSSREHAAMLPMYLGTQAVIAKSYARIHKENLFNYGIIPLNFKNEDDYKLIEQGDKLVINNLLKSIEKGEVVIEISNKNKRIECILDASDFDKNMLIQGGALNYLANKIKNN